MKTNTTDSKLKINAVDILSNILTRDGFLFILWGWIMFISFFASYLEGKVIISLQLEDLISKGGFILGILAIGFSIYYLYLNRSKLKSNKGFSLLIVWIGLLGCNVSINLIQNNILHSINFELQHPIFMTTIGFAIIITGSIMLYWPTIVGGLIFGVLGYICSYFKLQDQLLLEAIAWLIAFIIPGHILFAKSKKI